MRDCRHRVLVAALALGFAALTACSNGTKLSREEARSEIRSAVSLAAEAELFVDFVRGGHVTRHYAEGHAAYLGDAVKQALNEMEGATPEAPVQNAIAECITQLKRLGRELSSMHAEFDNSSELATAKDRISDIPEGHRESTVEFMNKLLGITLGIMTALGGFVDLGQIVFTMQAGALFGYKLLWTVLFGTAAIIVYMEMCGRVAVVAKEPVFAVVRNCLGFRWGVITLIASNLLNVITCAAELAGVAIVVHLLTGWPEKLALAGSALVLGAIVFFFRFQWIERIFGLWGLVMVMFAVSAVTLHPDWHQVTRGLLPTMQHGGPRQTLLYDYFAVGMFSALLMEYEVHFYSSGALEEDWTVKDLGENFLVASLGSALGALLTAALLILAVILFLPRGIFPDMLSTTTMAGAFPFGQKALILALLGTLACLAGAAVETGLSGGYNLCQFFNLAWGKNVLAKSAPVFTATWIGMFLLALLIAATGLRPLQLVDISIIFGMAIMPLTYYPILKVAADKNVMGKHVNNRFDTIVGTFFLIAITVAAVAAIPLMIATHSGKP